MQTLFSKTTENTYVLNLHAHDTRYHPFIRFTRRNIAYSEEKDQFIFENANFKEGKHAEGKRYFFWETASKQILRPMLGGVQVLSIKPFVTQNLYSRKSVLAVYPNFKHEAVEAWLDKQGFLRVEQVPLLAHYGVSIGSGGQLWLGDQQGFSSSDYKAPFQKLLLTCETPMEFVKAAFGKTRYRKDLVKAVADAPLPLVNVAWAMRGLVPIDWIIAYLRSCPQELHRTVLRHDTSADVLMFRKLMKMIPRENDRRSIMQDTLSADRTRFMHWQDSIRLYFEPEPSSALRNHPDEFWQETRLRTFEELHDEAMGLFQTHSRFVPSSVDVHKVYKVPEPIEALHGEQFGDYHIEVAQTVDTLRKWGRSMNNCIETYWQGMIQKSTVLGAVYRNEDMVANFELDYRDEQPVLRQLLGQGNTYLESDVKQEVVNALESHRVDVTRRWWGSD